MSHFVKIQTQITEEKHLIKALEQFGVTKTTQGANLHIDRENAQVSIKLDENVGFQKQADGTLAMVGDPYYYHGPGRNFIRRFYNEPQKAMVDLSTKYAVERTRAELEAIGFTIDENAEGNVGSDGLIRMSATTLFCNF